MEKSIPKISPQKVSTSSEVTASIQHGEKSSSCSVSPVKSPENLEKKVLTKEADIPTASAQHESFETDAVSQDEEEEFNLRLQSSDEETFEDTVADVSELKENKSSAVETFFSDIESSDNSQVYEPKSLKTASVEAKKAVSIVSKVVDTKRANIEKTQLDFDPVESEEDFEESRSQEEDSILLPMEDDSLDTEIQSQDKAESNERLEAEIGPKVMSDVEDSQIIERKKEEKKETPSSGAALNNDNQLPALLETEKKPPAENISVLEAVDVAENSTSSPTNVELDDISESSAKPCVPEGKNPFVSPMKSPELMEVSDDSLVPLETNEEEPAQNDKKGLEESEKDIAMEVDTDIPSLGEDKASAGVYEASSESMKEVVESQEAMEVDSDLQQTIEEDDSNKNDIALGDGMKSESTHDETSKTVDKLIKTPDVTIEEVKDASGDDKSLKSPIQSSTSTETPIESLKVAEKYEASADPTESVTSTETPVSTSNAVVISETTPDPIESDTPSDISIAPLNAEEKSDARAEDSTGDHKLLNKPENAFETGTKSLEIQQTFQVTVDIVDKSQENEQYLSGEEESLNKTEKIPKEDEVSTDDKKEDSIENEKHLENTQPTLETDKSSMEDVEECEDVSTETEKSKVIAEEDGKSLEESVLAEETAGNVETDETFLDKPENTTVDAENSVELLKSPEKEQIDEHPTGTATSSDILLGIDKNSLTEIVANTEDLTGVNELSKKPDKCTADEESDKPDEHISEPAKTLESAQNLERNVDDSTKDEELVVSAEDESKKTAERTTDSEKTLKSGPKPDENAEDSTKAEKSAELDEEVDVACQKEKSQDKSGEKSEELRKKSTEDSPSLITVDKSEGAKTNNLEKPDDGTAKMSKPEDPADVQIENAVAEILPTDSIKSGDAPDVKVKSHSKEESNPKPISIDPEIIEIDDDDLEEDQNGEHTTASDEKPSPAEGKEKEPQAEVAGKQVVTDKMQPEHDKSPSEVAVPLENTTEIAKSLTKDSAEADKVIESAVAQDVEMLEIIDDKDNADNLKQPTGDATMKAGDTASAQASPEDDESLLVIDTSHKEDNEPEDIDMDTETEQTATSAPTTTDSSSEGSLEIFYDKECVHYECKHGSKNFYRATLFTLNYYKISKKRNKAQYVCEECYDRALSSYEEMCKTLTKKQPLLHGATFKGQEFVEIIDSSEEDEDDDAGDNFKDENVLPKDSIELLEAELEGAIRKVMHNVDIQNQLSWTKQILQQRLNNLQEDTEFVSVQLRQLQKKADNMHNSLYQCPKIKIRQLTPLDLNSGRTYNPETESTIPPMGEVLRTSIHVNETYYAVKNKAIASWVPCKVMEAVENYNPYSKNQKHFKIKFLKSKYPMLKTVSAKHMAFFNPPKVRLPIGTRVIAYFDVTSLSRGKEKMLIPSAFYPGIIAEPLKQSNKFRYLVFYDDGYFQYVYHKDVRLVCQASENVWEDVHHQSREFIHNYLTQYAVNRPMVQTQKGQSMLVDYNGKWIYARVIDVDCSLVQMLFEGQSRSEWIYRGSTRLGPVYKESNNLVQKNQTNTSRLSRRTEPFIRYINGDDSSSSHQSQEPPQQGQPKSGEVRSVAKKSVSKTDNSHQSSQPVPTVRHLNNSTIFVDDDNKPKGKVVYYTARKNLPPRDYEPHICSPTCPFNVTHNLSFYSPLAKPLLSGWERQVFRQKSKKFIVYRGPCGKRLRSMEELHRYLRVTENELNVDNFDFSAETNCLAEYVIESCIVQKKDISNGKEKMPIPCVNYYDNTMPPDCIYSSRRIPTEGVPLNLDKDFLVGCDCEDDCSDKSKCSCWELTYAGAKYGMPNVPNEMVGYQYKRLYEHVPTGIYECNARCKCKANCVNRVVQQPLQSKLQVFKTSNRGWGLRCINDVPRGSFICIYAGHLLNEQKANEGGLDAGDEYFAELDYIEVAEQIKEGYESDVAEPDDEEDLYNPDKEDEDDDEFVVPSESNRNRSFNTRSRSRRSTKNGSDVEHDSQERQVISFEPNKTMGQPDNSTSEKPTIRKLFGKDEACYIMDAKITGNLGRYFNHSCSPNLFVQNVFVDTHDLRFPWVAFFAFTHIRAGTELTWNYNYEVGVVPGKVLYCQCGAPNCRQRLL